MVKHLEDDENNFKHARLLLDAGKPEPPMRKKYRELNQRLLQLKEELETAMITLKQYVRQAAYFLHDHDVEDETSDEET